MEPGKNFNHKESEEKWYAQWLEKKYFSNKPDEREPYTIVMPPPNVTGILHMGHALNNTIQDVLIRNARMHGKNACWVPGTDHAAIATETKVVQMLREQGITKSSLSREEFLKYAWEWKKKYGGIILEQLKKLGCSADWDRTAFTMDEHYSNSVIKVFVDLYKKGLIYRGQRMIHWDVKAKTALSDEEVIYKEVNSKLYYVSYTVLEETNVGLHGLGAVSTGVKNIVIATVRPETILGDVAIAVNPKDERYKNLVGRTALVPLINRRIPIIADDYVEMEFGTGALKITPAHDINDYNIGKKYNLDVIDVLNDDGTMSQAAQLFIGEDRFEARKKIVEELEASKHIVRIEDYKNQIGFSERSDAVVEPRLSLQWWVSTKKLSEPALKAATEESIKFFPSKYKNTYNYWMENIKDWCISRQLWWGQRIPAWYDEDGNVYVAETEEEAAENSKLKAENLRQDEDVLDTWFSSWLWPIETFKGISNPGNADINYYYPTQTLVTAPEIIFFWVARMIMSGFEYKNGKPFSDVYFTGIVRDEQGRKMSKSLGNSPDLLALIDKYGADAIRFGILISSPAGNDLLFDVKEESTLKQGSFFINKIWNAMKLVKMWEGRKTESLQDRKSEGSSSGLSDSADFPSLWFENRMNEVKIEIEKLYAQFKLSEALKTIYSLIWNDFCSWYLEWIKPGFEQPIDANVYSKTVGFFEELMQLLHPFMPFVTEEIYHLLKDQEDDLCIKQIKKLKVKIQEDVLGSGESLKKIITAIRDARNKNNIKPKETIELFIQTNAKNNFTSLDGILKKQVNASVISLTNESIAGTIVVTNEEYKFYIRSEQQTNTAAITSDLEKDLAYQKNFLQSVQKKLSNERFVQNAKPEVVEMERKKQADAEARIKTIEESLTNLGYE